MFFSKVSSLVSSWLWSCQQGDVIVVSIHTICDLHNNYPHSASFSLHVHGFIFISSPIKVPACVHLDWILRSGGEGGPQPSCISSPHAKVWLSLAFFISLVVAIFYHFPRLDICLTQSFFLFQLFELGNADARGELIFATMAISKPSWENAWTTAPLKQLHHRKDLKAWQLQKSLLQPTLPTNQPMVEHWQVSIGSAVKKRGVKYLCCSILDTQVHISHLSVLVHHRII